MLWRKIDQLPAWFDILVILLFGTAFALLSLNNPYNFDEDSYIGAIDLAATSVIYRDFMHIQTPLQPLLLAPLTELFPGQVFTVLRLNNALLATLTLMAVYGAQRIAGVRGRVAVLTTVLLALCPPFITCATVVRNDLLPALLSSLAMAAAIVATRGERRAMLWWTLAGLAFGLATSAKISYALLLAGTGGYLLWRWSRAMDRRTAWQAVLVYSAGCVLGLSPTLVLAALAFDAFRFGVFDFALVAPFDWFRRNDIAGMLTWGSKIKQAVHVVLRSPALPALLTIVVLQQLRPKSGPRPETLLLNILIVTGTISSVLPTPAWSYYLLTLFLPLFVRLGIALEDSIDSGRPRGALAATTLGLLFALGPMVRLGHNVLHTLRTPPDRWLTARVEAEDRWIGEQLRAAGASGPIATLSTFLALDSGYPLDRRFASGVFVYRTGDLLSADDHRRFNTVGPATLAQFLDAEPPAAIVVGYMGTPRPYRITLDPDLRAYAQSRNYRLLRSPVGQAELYVNPTTSLAGVPAGSPP
jgi:4-amino-4-deoxy-L-arabinose transferase-like glycosyltransferase